VNGILNLDKPAGVTSFDVVARVKHLLREMRVGHGGTLDPLATGVLPIFLGQATRLMEYMAELSKTYRAVVELGAVTATYDAEGEVIRRCDASDKTFAQVEAALALFRGDIMQAPPAFSALKQHGMPLYRLARQGVTPVVEKRPVHIYRLEMLDFNSPRVSLEIECSKGTYIRSLAYDLGEALGCGAYLKSLTRTAYGPFNITDAITLERLGAAASEGVWSELVRQMDTLLTDWTAVTLTKEQALGVVQGKVQALETEGERLRAYDTEGGFLAILKRDAETKLWQPHKVFCTQQRE
jgi:tRNA pseudouridine55 synthase